MKLNNTYSACSLVGFWADKLGWCWFVVRGKHYWLANKPWLKPTSEQADYSVKYTMYDFNIICKQIYLSFESLNKCRCMLVHCKKELRRG